MAELQIEKLTKAELRRINKDAQDFLKSRSGNQIEYEFHMQNIASAIYGQFDWLNPEVNFDARSRNHNKPYFTDWTKPLPLQGFPDKPKIPYQFFFNKDLRNLQLTQDNSKQKYTSSLTISVPAARYEVPAIEESTPVFSNSIVAYDKDTLYGIQHWPEHRRLGYTHMLGNKSIENVKNKSRIIVIEAKAVN